MEECVYTCSRRPGPVQNADERPADERENWNRARGRLDFETRGAVAVQTEL